MASGLSPPPIALGKPDELIALHGKSKEFSIVCINLRNSKTLYPYIA